VPGRGAFRALRGWSLDLTLGLADCHPEVMAKALYGHLLSGDPQLAAEIARLRRRVAELELENSDLRTALLGMPVDLEQLPTAPEPALT